MAPITVVVPVCGKDAHLAVATLRLMAGWEKLPRCIVAHERGFDPADVLLAAGLAFEAVWSISYEPWPGSQEWPHPQNNAWFEVARAMAAELRHLEWCPWLWLEPDAMPLRKGWLAELERAYAECGQPVMGCRMVEGHVNGVAVYAADMVSVAPMAFLHYDHPFDKSLHKLVPNRLAHTDLVASWPKAKGGEAGHHFRNLDELPQEAVLFHGCTDGSLQRLLAGGEPEPLPVKPDLVWKEPLPEPPPVRRSGFSQVVAGGWWHLGKRSTMCHVVEMHKQRDAASRLRVERAFRSWETLYADGCQPCHLWEDDYPRDSRDIGDDRRLPYLKDVLAAGLGRADVVVLTNDDTALLPGLAHNIRETLADRECVSSFRVNVDEPLLNLHGRRYQGKPDLGRDLFALRDDWLRANWHRVPDMLLGEVEWDMVLAALVRLANGETFTLADRGKPMSRSELPVGWVLHERHKPGWKGEPRAGRGHNRRLAAKWFVENGLEAVAGR